MTGYIDVAPHGLETDYTAHCGCGWVGPEEAVIEWADVALLAHFGKAHPEEQAA